MSGFNALMWVLAVGLVAVVCAVLLGIAVETRDRMRSAELLRKLAFLSRHTKCEGGVWVTRVERRSWHAGWEQDTGYAMAQEAE
jgi:hypothetical protein